MNSKTQELHEITKIDLRYKLFYILRDLGIKSADESAVATWNLYVVIQGELIKGTWDDIQ